MSTFQLANVHPVVALAAPDGTGVDSYKVTTRKGTQTGIGVTVSGAGAWAHVKGRMSFQTLRLEDSKTYEEIKNEYSIGGGISAFWAWLGISANASAHKEEIHSVFQEISQSQKTQGHAAIDLAVTGLYPNVSVDALAYALVMEVTDSSGNTFHFMSSGDPAADTGAVDGDGMSLPTKENNSTIEL